ncbi:MAG: hypothetical protein ACHQ52_08495 [Candidatus Eisenbacteria bacterium]
MKRMLTTLLPFGMAVAVLAAAVPNVSHAFTLRSPQVGFNSTSLQNYLNGIGESITVTTDQLDAQVWTSSISGNSTFTLMIELAGNAASNNIGLYNTNDPSATPALFQLFPGAAGAGWYVTAHFAGGNVSVALFDNNGVFQGSTFYPGVNANGFGFYLQGPGGTFYSQDGRNGGDPQMLTYAGTGVNFGEWWECFEDLPYLGSSADFDDAILLLQSVVPTATHAQTWGGVKSSYR